MSDRKQGDRHDTFVPTPQHIKPKGSHDNAVEMAAGGESERRALAARDEKLAAGDTLPPQPMRRDMVAETDTEQRIAANQGGRTDSWAGTGIGYAGEGAATYGTQGATGASDTLADVTETAGRQPHVHTGDTARTTDIEQARRHDQVQQQEEVQQMERASTPDKQGQESVHGENEPVSGEGVVGGSGKESATDAAAETLQSAQGHVEPAINSVTEHAQGAAADVTEHAQGALTDAHSEAQDRLQSVRANVQTMTDQWMGAVTDRTDQLKDSVGERGEQAKQAANQTATQAGEKLTDLATALREKTQTLEPESPVANMATMAVGALEQTGTYLQESTPDDWMGDLKRLIARKPLESVLVAASIGYLIARAFRGGHSGH
jgi:hypothetical protein